VNIKIKNITLITVKILFSLMMKQKNHLSVNNNKNREILGFYYCFDLKNSGDFCEKK
jgi:hypothetical protein